VGRRESSRRPPNREWFLAWYRPPRDSAPGRSNRFLRPLPTVPRPPTRTRGKWHHEPVSVRGSILVADQIRTGLPQPFRRLRPCDVPLEFVFLPATTQLRPPQATGGNSHPRCKANCPSPIGSSTRNSTKSCGHPHRRPQPLVGPTSTNPSASRSNLAFLNANQSDRKRRSRKGRSRAERPGPRSEFHGPPGRHHARGRPVTSWTGSFIASARTICTTTRSDGPKT
jgi:hypothetical protein